MQTFRCHVDFFAVGELLFFADITSFVRSNADAYAADVMPAASFDIMSLFLLCLFFSRFFFSCYHLQHVPRHAMHVPRLLYAINE